MGGNKMENKEKFQNLANCLKVVVNVYKDGEDGTNFDKGYTAGVIFAYQNSAKLIQKILNETENK